MIEGRQKLINILFLQVVYIIYSFVLIVAKLASAQSIFSFRFIFLFSVEIGVFAFYALLWQQLIKRMDLNTAYSVKGTVILWTLLLAKTFFNESIKFTNILGAVIILLGIYLVMGDE
jgi:drug/metabolite transporter (DMT)-like permease